MRCHESRAIWLVDGGTPQGRERGPGNGLERARRVGAELNSNLHPEARAGRCCSDSLGQRVAMARRDSWCGPCPQPHRRCPRCRVALDSYRFEWLNPTPASPRKRPRDATGARVLKWADTGKEAP